MQPIGFCHGYDEGVTRDPLQQVKACSVGSKVRACTSVLNPRCSISWGALSLLMAGIFRPSCCLLAARRGDKNRRAKVREDACPSNWLASMLFA